MATNVKLSSELLQSCSIASARPRHVYDFDLAPTKQKTGAPAPFPASDQHVYICLDVAQPIRMLENQINAALNATCPNKGAVSEWGKLPSA